MKMEVRMVIRRVSDVGRDSRPGWDKLIAPTSSGMKRIPFRAKIDVVAIGNRKGSRDMQ